MQRVRSALNYVTKTSCEAYSTEEGYKNTSRMPSYEVDGCAYCEFRGANICIKEIPTIQITTSIGRNTRWMMRRLVDGLIDWAD
jgi:hypothetical protein